MKVMEQIVKIRKKIAERLKREIARRNLSLEQIAEQYNISIEVIDGYLKATRKLNLSELGNICSALKINLRRGSRRKKAVILFGDEDVIIYFLLTCIDRYR